MSESSKSTRPPSMMKVAGALLDDDLLEDWCTVVQHGGKSVDAILRTDLPDYLAAAFERADPSDAA